MKVQYSFNCIKNTDRTRKHTYVLTLIVLRSWVTSHCFVFPEFSVTLSRAHTHTLTAHSCVYVRPRSPLQCTRTDSGLLSTVASPRQ